MLSGSNEQDMTEHTQTELLLIVHFGFNAGNAFQKMLSLFIIFFKNNSLRKTSGTREDESLSLPDTESTWILSVFCDAHFELDHVYMELLPHN